MNNEINSIINAICDKFENCYDGCPLRKDALKHMCDEDEYGTLSAADEQFIRDAFVSLGCRLDNDIVIDDTDINSILNG